jgi:hypothetical protein
MTFSVDENVPEPYIFTREGPVPFSLAPQAFRGEWITKDSGKRQEYSTGMKRDVNDGKPRFDLISPREMPYDKLPLTRWAQLMERGAVKYGIRNWELAETQEELDRFRESALRHMMQYLSGESDEDHMAAVFFNLSAIELVKWKLSGSGPQPPAA